MYDKDFVSLVIVVDIVMLFWIVLKKFGYLFLFWKVVLDVKGLIRGMFRVFVIVVVFFIVKVLFVIYFKILEVFNFILFELDKGFVWVYICEMSFLGFNGIL